MPSLTDLRRQLAADLLGIGAVALAPEDPFVWSSGLRAPVYCDNRKTLAHPQVRRRVADGVAKVLEQQSGEDTPTLVAGTATAGIPHATLLAKRRSAPLSYVRSGVKEHGTGRRIEGADPAGERAVVIEDLVSTGASALGAARALSEAGAEVTGVLAIFSYRLQAAADAFAEFPWPLHTLTDFPALLDVAEDDNDLASEQLRALRRWHRDPEAWSEECGGTEVRECGGNGREARAEAA
ncbi:MAG: orotate phosphoribosyltransferase [Bacteroidetes bacterium QS_9_68_14]|nr:MAG: orotate phosphoribosyltransferase [Bacteroidetes bacterium QS_9_68_14]